MKQALLPSFSLWFFLGFSSFASSESLPESRISVPFTIGLADLASYANERLPETLHHAEYGRTCVEPERACTKVPEFRGFSVTMKNRCIEVTPRIDCTITETVRREGPMRISGSGGQIVLGQDIFGSGTVRGRGEIGKHIRQTVRTKAELTLSASPHIASDWTAKVPVKIAYRWLERPEFRLFNLFPVTLGSTLGPPLDRAIHDFENSGLQAELDRIDLKSEAQKLWQAIQAPHRLELPGGEPLYLHLRPRAIGLSGPTFGDNTLQARLDIALTALVSGNADGPQTTSLPNLTSMENAGTELRVPVRIKAETLNNLAGNLLPWRVPLGEEGRVNVTVHDVDLSIDGDRLSLEMIVDANGGPLSLEREAIRVSMKPVLMSESQEIRFSEIDLGSGEGGLAGLAKSAMLNAAELFLADAYSIALNDEIAALERAMNAALNRDLTAGLSLVGGGRLTVDDLRLLPDEAAIQVTISSAGSVRVVGFNAMR